MYVVIREVEDVKRLLDFASFNGCSIKFIELANDKDKIVTLDEIKSTLLDLGIKERLRERKKIIMSDNIILTRTSCEYAQRTNNPSLACKEDMNFFVTPEGAINRCVVTNKRDLIIDEIKNRNNERLVKKLKNIGAKFGSECVYGITVPLK